MAHTAVEHLADEVVHHHHNNHPQGTGLQHVARPEHIPADHRPGHEQHPGHLPAEVEKGAAELLAAQHHAVQEARDGNEAGAVAAAAAVAPEQQQQQQQQQAGGEGGEEQAMRVFSELATFFNIMWSLKRRPGTDQDLLHLAQFQNMQPGLRERAIKATLATVAHDPLVELNLLKDLAGIVSAQSESVEMRDWPQRPVLGPISLGLLAMGTVHAMSGYVIGGLHQDGFTHVVLPHPTERKLSDPISLPAFCRVLLGRTRVTRCLELLQRIVHGKRLQAAKDAAAKAAAQRSSAATAATDIENSAASQEELNNFLPGDLVEFEMLPHQEQLTARAVLIQIMAHTAYACPVESKKCIEMLQDEIALPAEEMNHRRAPCTRELQAIAFETIADLMAYPPQEGEPPLSAAERGRPTHIKDPATGISMNRGDVFVKACELRCNPDEVKAARARAGVHKDDVHALAFPQQTVPWLSFESGPATIVAVTALLTSALALRWWLLKDAKN